VLQYWRRQRLLVLPLADPEQVRRFLAEAQETAARWADRRRRLPAILEGLGPERDHLRAQVEALREAVDAAYERLRLPLLDEMRERGDEMRTGRLGAQLWSQTSAEERQQLYSLHNLLQLLEEIGVTVPARRWLHLGNTLYELEKWDLALQAYQRVHRRGWADPAVHPKEIAGDLARCYLSVAQARLDAFRRISGDAAVVLDLVEYEWAEGHLSRCILNAEGALDREWLARRPADLSEFGYVNNRLAEIEIARGQLEPARRRLEAAIAHQEAGRDLYRPPMGDQARAFAFNHLGKSHRLCVEIAVAQGRLDRAVRHFRHAREALLAAVEALPGLGYPFGHLFDLLRLVEEKGLAVSLGIDVGAERAALRAQLDALDDEWGRSAREWGRSAREWLRGHYLEVWE
jgi:tetratricopeptide (TPR) repeat protein